MSYNLKAVNIQPLCGQRLLKKLPVLSCNCLKQGCEYIRSSVISELRTVIKGHSISLTDSRILAHSRKSSQVKTTHTHTNNEGKHAS